MKNVSLTKYTEVEIGEYINDVIKRFSVAIAKAGVENAGVVAENKVVGEFFPGRKSNDKQWVFHIQNSDTQENIGWLWLADRGKGELRVADIQVDENHRQKGYATRAMIIAEELARDREFSLLSLNVFDDNEIAKKMYQRLGYSVVEEGSGRSEMHKTVSSAPRLQR